jgi:hypothetical protein
MSINEQLPKDRTSITIVVLVLLCAAGLAYSQGWFNWSSTGAAIETNKTSTSQDLGQEETKVDAVQMAQAKEEPVDTATE